MDELSVQTVTKGGNCLHRKSQYSAGGLKSVDRAKVVQLFYFVCDSQIMQPRTQLLIKLRVNKKYVYIYIYIYS
jgi:hypothetical protein